jgi:hypothetical protein
MGDIMEAKRALGGEIKIAPAGRHFGLNRNS